MSGVDLGDYVDVASRLAIFREKYPEGSLQPADPSEPYRLLTVGDQTFVTVVAAAYRTPEDPRPGIGMAQELIPGRTSFTKGSELQNAETSAWGRAIVAALAADTKGGVASADEVRNRQAEREAPKRETDVAWLSDVEQRITFATSPGELRDLDVEAHHMFAEGKLTTDDAKRLKAQIDARDGELRGVPA